MGVFSGLMGLPMLEESVVGGYHDMVRALQKKSNEALDEQKNFTVFTSWFRGGRGEAWRS